MNMTSLKSFVALHGIALLYILSFAVLCYGTDQIPFGQIHNRALLQVNSTVNANGTANNNGNQTVVDPGPTNPPNDLDKVNEVIRKVGDAKLGNCSIWAGIGGGCNKKYTSSDVTVSAAINFVLGFLCFLGFGILRKHVKVYKARLCSPATTIKPPPLPEGGVAQVLSWVIPVLKMSDESLLRSSGLDALMFSRFLMLCVQFFLPISILSVGILLPIHYTATDDEINRCGYKTVLENQDGLLKTTMSNMCPGDKLLWVHVVFVYMVLAWGMYLLNKHYIAYAALRHHYVGMPQKPNPWFTKYLEHFHNQSVVTSPESSAAFDSPVGVLSSDKASMGDHKTPQPSTREETSEEMKKMNSNRGILFNLAQWKNVALAWIRPETLLNYKGEEVDDLQVFSSAHQMYVNSSMKRSPNQKVSLESRRSLEPRDSKIVSISEDHSFRLSESKEAINLEGSEVLSSTYLDKSKVESKELTTAPSLAAVKWWEVYKEVNGSKVGMERDVMERPSVRHMKAVNTIQDGIEVSVNAAQYTVLVTDIPCSQEDINTIRRSMTEDTLASDDVDGIKVDPAGDICAEVFRNIFPDSFRHVVPVKDFRKVTKLLHQWDQAYKKLEICEAVYAMYGRRRTVRTGFLGLFGKKVDAIKFHESKVQEISKLIKKERKRVLCSEPSLSRFVIFDNQIDAAVVAQSVLLPLDGTKFVTHRAPSPDNVNWLTLFQTGNSRFMRRIAVIPLIALIMIIPAGLFSTLLTNLDAAFCQVDSKIYWEWYCRTATTSTFSLIIKRTITGWLPSILLSVWQNVVVTRTLYFVALVECVAISLDGMDRRITALYFYWNFLNIFLGSILGSTIFSLLGKALSLTSIADVISIIGQAITSSSNFITSYALMRALFLVPLKLVFPHPQVLVFVLKSLLSVTCCKHVGVTQRDRYSFWEPKSFMYGKEAGIVMLMSLIGVAYVSTCPVTAMAVSFYFIFMYIVSRHHLLYVYARSYESGGELFPVLFDRFVIMLVTLAYFTGFQLITMKAWAQSVILLVSTPPILYRYHRVCTKKYRDVSTNVPLDIAGRQACAEVPPQMYIPSELRSASVGWHPEQGKGWNGYGMPRFV